MQEVTSKFYLIKTADTEGKLYISFLINKFHIIEE